MLIVRQLSFDDYLEVPIIDLAGKHIAITGFLDYTRAVVVEWIVSCGGIYVTTVSSKTDYLVVGRIKRTRNMRSEDTRKLHRAHELLASGGHIKLLSQDELLRSLEVFSA